MGDQIINGSGIQFPLIIESGVALVKIVSPAGSGYTESSDPLIKYKPANIDNSTATVRYAGFVDRTGSWYIMQTSGTSAIQTQTGYKAGVGSYTTAWGARTTGSYPLFYEVF